MAVKVSKQNERGGVETFTVPEPFDEFAAITPHNTNLNEFDAIYVGGTGAVAVKRRATDATAVTFAAVPVGTILPVKCEIVMSTGTTATNLIGLKH